MTTVRRWRLVLLLLMMAASAMAPTAQAASAGPGISSEPERTSADSASFSPVPGSCTGNDRVAAIPGYYATEKTCLEWNDLYGMQAHSVTRCWRDGGTQVACQKINGDTVTAELYASNTRFAVTKYPDPDCVNCKENSHYSVPHCRDGYFFLDVHARVANIRVIFPNGTLSAYHTHRSQVAQGYTALPCV